MTKPQPRIKMNKGHKPYGFTACSTHCVTHQILWFCDNNFWQTNNINTDCCFDHNHTTLRYNFCKFKIPYTK